MNIWPKLGERSFLCGKTGSGKTFALLKMLKRFEGKRQIQLIATKEDKDLLSMPVPIVDRLANVHLFRADEHPFVIYYPVGEELADPEIVDRWCQWVYERKHTVAGIDELTQIADKTKPRPGFLNLYTRGRSQDVTVIGGTQRPVGVPPIVYTEAENFYKFYLSDERDRQRVAQYSHPLMQNQVLDRHGFHYFNPFRSNNVFYIKSL